MAFVITLSFPALIAVISPKVKRAGTSFANGSISMLCYRSIPEQYIDNPLSVPLILNSLLLH